MLVPVTYVAKPARSSIKILVITVILEKSVLSVITGKLLLSGLLLISVIFMISVIFVISLILVISVIIVR